MIRGIYSAAAGMTTQYKKIDVLGNNISNVNTAGYKQNDVTLTTFGNELASRTSDSEVVGNMPLCVYLGKENTDLTDGTLNFTGLNTDLGIQGEGFFRVRDPQGNFKYTRSGEFVVDDMGQLTTPNGDTVMNGDTDQPLMVGNGNFSVDFSGGDVTSNGRAIGRLAVFMPPDPNNTAAITKRRDGYFDIQNARAYTGNIRQGWLENSNTDVIENMTGLMDSQRAFQGNQQAMSVALQTEDKLVNEVGNVR